MRATTTKSGIDDSYFVLVRSFPLRPIRSEKELDRAVAVLRKLSAAEPEENMEDGTRDYVEALSLLVQRFEQQRRRSMLPKLAPVDRVEFLMGERGMTVSDLGRVLGSQLIATSLLRRKRTPTIAQIIKLAKHFGVSPALFIE